MDIKVTYILNDSESKYITDTAILFYRFWNRRGLTDKIKYKDFFTVEQRESIESQLDDWSSYARSGRQIKALDSFAEIALFDTIAQFLTTK